MSVFSSGYVTTHQIWKHKEVVKINYLRLFIKRYIRITIIVLSGLAVIIVTPILGDGPHWKDIIETESQMCERDWWKFLLYINGNSLIPNACAPHFWFLSAVMQLFILTLPLLFLLLRWPKIGVTVSSFVIVIGIVAHVIYYIVTNNIVVLGTLVQIEKYESYMKDNFFRSYFHITPYFLGLLTGYVFTKKNNIQLSKTIVIIGWCGSILSIGLVTFAMYNYVFDNSPNKNLVLTYNIFSQFLYIVGVAWICIVCINGYGGFIGNLFSWKVFIILDKVNVWIYMIHLVILKYILGTSRTLTYVSHLNMWKVFAFVTVSSYIISIGFYILIQSPLNSIMEKLFPRKRTTVIEKDLSAAENGVMCNKISN